jgi:hypothetical protein
VSASAPRPAVLVLLGVVVVFGLFLFMRRGGGEESAAPAPASEATTQPATPGAPTASPTPPTAAGTQPVAPATATAPATAKPAKRAPSGQRRDLPPRVERALRADKVLMVLFWNPRGVDDRAVRRAVADVPRRGGEVAVFVERPRRAFRYATITSVADLNHTPALVVVNRHDEAKVLSGFVDQTTVNQQVVEALRGD